MTNNLSGIWGSPWPPSLVPGPETSDCRLQCGPAWHLQPALGLLPSPLMPAAEHERLAWAGKLAVTSCTGPAAQESNCKDPGWLG